MSQFPQLHSSEVTATVEVKVCEHCSGQFFRKGIEVLCLKCKHKPYGRQAMKQLPGDAYWITGIRKWRRTLNG